jgi:hypothetical protein
MCTMRKLELGLIAYTNYRIHLCLHIVYIYLSKMYSIINNITSEVI